VLRASSRAVSTSGDTIYNQVVTCRYIALRDYVVYSAHASVKRWFTGDSRESAGPTAGSASSRFTSDVLSQHNLMCAPGAADLARIVRDLVQGSVRAQQSAVAALGARRADP
jgi:hypothetical protein